jgi:hypothetical protein
MGYSLLQISEILLKADKTMYRLGTVAYENMFSEDNEDVDFERDIIYIYKKAVEYADDFYVGTLKLDQVVERLANKLTIYNYGSLNPIYSDVSILNPVLPTGYVLNDLADVTITNLQDNQILKYNADLGQWVNTGSNAAIRSTQAFTATLNQTVFVTTSQFTAPLLDVYLNGVRLNSASYTTFGNHTITLYDGCLADDIIDVTIYDPQTDILDMIGYMKTSVYDKDEDGVVDDAEKISIIARNSTGATIHKGKIVYLQGSTGNRPNILLAQANTEASSSKTFGVVVADIANNADGQVAAIGTLHDLDTRSNAPNPFTADTLLDGDKVWLSATDAGYITRNPPVQPNHTVFIGFVVRTSPTNGRIVYEIQNGFELEELHNVLITAAANNDILYYDSATSLWKNKPINVANIYNSDGTLTGNRVVTMGAFSLTFDGGINIRHNTQSALISTYHETGSEGLNIYIGGGGQLSQTGGGASFLGSRNTSLGRNNLLSNTTGRGNTSIGAFAMSSNTTGIANTSVGSNALRFNTTGNFNTVVGNGAMGNNATGSSNVVMGGGMGSNVSGSFNISIGSNSLAFNTANSNIAVGHGAGYGTGPNANTTGENNIFIGYLSVGASATESNRTWIGNSSTTSTWLAGNLLLGSTTDTGLAKLQVTGAIQQSSVLSSLLKTDGSGVLVAATLGTDYSVLPSQSGNTGKFLSTDGSALSWADVVSGVSSFNTRTGAVTLTSGDVTGALGYTPISNNIYTADGTLTANRTVTMGAFTLSFEKDVKVNGLTVGKGASSVFANTALGENALRSVTSGNFNTAVGRSNSYSITTAQYNTAIGNSTLFSNISSDGNTAVGMQSLTSTTGQYNTALGNRSGANITTGQYNIILGAYGFGAGGITTGSYNTVIGSQVSGLTATLSNNIILADGQGNIRIRAWDTGNVGIGTTTDAGYKLDVNGTARVSGDLYANSGIILNGWNLSVEAISGSTALVIRTPITGRYLMFGRYGAGTGYGNFQYLAQGNDSARFLFASVEFNSSNPPPSALVTMDSTVQGFLPPRMTTTQRDAIASPATGLVIYNTTTLAANVYNGTSWVGMGGDNIYTSDGILTGNRTVTMGGNALLFSGSDFTTRVFSTGRLSVNRSSSPLGLIHIQKPANSTEAHLFLSTPFPSSTPTSIVFQNNDFNTTGTSTGIFSFDTDGQGFGLNKKLNISSGDLTVPSGGLTLSQNTGTKLTFGPGEGFRYTPYDFDLITNNITRARFYNSGNIVIGTSTPTDAGYKLDVQGTGRYTGNLAVATSTTSFSGLTVGSGNSGQNHITVDSAQNSELRFATNGTTRSFFRQFEGNELRFYTAGGTIISNWNVANNNFVFSNQSIVGGADTSSVMEIRSTNRGFLFPRLTTTERNAITSPATGLQVYNSTTNTNDFYNGTAWVSNAAGNIYTTDGTLTGNRTVTYTGFDLTFYTVRPSIGNRYITFHNSGRVTFNGTTENTSYEVNVNGGLLAGAGSMIGGTSGVNFDSGNLRLIFQDWSSVSFVRGGANSVLYSDGTNASLGNGAARLNIASGSFSTNGGGVGSGAHVYSIGSGTNSITTGAYTVSIGSENLYSITTGSTNIAIGGRWAGSGVSRGNTGNHSSSIFLGVGTGATTNSTTLTNTTIIGHDITTDASNTVILGRSDQNVTIGGVLNAGFKLDVNGTARVSGGTTLVVGANNVTTLNLPQWNSLNNGFDFLMNDDGILRFRRIATSVATNMILFDRVTNGMTITESTNLILPSIVSNSGSGSVRIRLRNDPNVFVGWDGDETVKLAIQNDGVARYVSLGGSSSSGTVFTPILTAKVNTASVGIGTKDPNASSILEILSTTKGFLPPRMTSTQRTAISSPAVGLIVYQTDATEGTYEYTSTGWRIINAAGGGSGTVTTVSVASANGFAGTVANATTTPAITISTTVTGLLKGNGTAISAATAGTDYLTPADEDYSVTSQTSNYTETVTRGTKIIKCDTTSAGFTVTLPTAVGNKALLIIKKVAGSGALTIDGNSTETIDGGTTATINKVYESITLISDNTNWQIV